MWNFGLQCEIFQFIWLHRNKIETYNGLLSFSNFVLICKLNKFLVFVYNNSHANSKGHFIGSTSESSSSIYCIPTVKTHLTYLGFMKLGFKHKYATYTYIVQLYLIALI